MIIEAHQTCPKCGGKGPQSVHKCWTSQTILVDEGVLEALKKSLDTARAEVEKLKSDLAAERERRENAEAKLTGACWDVSVVVERQQAIQERDAARAEVAELTDEVSGRISEIVELNAEIAALRKQLEVHKAHECLCPDCRDKVPKGTCPRCSEQSARASDAQAEKLAGLLKEYCSNAPPGIQERIDAALAAYDATKEKP